MYRQIRSICGSCSFQLDGNLKKKIIYNFLLGTMRNRIDLNHIIKMLRCSEKLTSEEVLECIGEKTTLLNIIPCRKANWIGHILRRNCYLTAAIEGQMTDVKE